MLLYINLYLTIIFEFWVIEPGGSLCREFGYKGEATFFRLLPTLILSIISTSNISEETLISLIARFTSTMSRTSAAVVLLLSSRPSSSKRASAAVSSSSSRSFVDDSNDDSHVRGDSRVRA
jgi:hypothetical protein